MNKKGYTLVELLAVIVIIALIGGIAAIAYNSFQSQTAERVFKTYMDNMHEATIMYFLSNPADKPNSTQTTLGNGRKIYLNSLNIEPIKNPYDMDDLCNNSNTYVEAIYNAGQDGSYTKCVGDDCTTIGGKKISGIKYHVCLNCNKFKECKDYTN